MSETQDESLSASIEASLPAVNRRPAKSFAQFRREYIAKHDEIRALVSDLKDLLPTTTQNANDFQTFENHFKAIGNNDPLPPSNIEQQKDINEGLLEQHNARMQMLEKFKNSNTDALDTIKEIEKELLALHTMCVNFAEERQNTLSEEFCDADAQHDILSAFQGSEQGQNCKDFNELIKRANSTNGITMKYNGEDLTIKKSTDGKLEIRSRDPKAMVDAAAAMGLKSINILEGTSTAQAVQIIEECNKRGIQVRNAKDFKGKDNLLNKIYEAGSKSPDLSTFANLFFASATPLEQGRFKAAALTNAAIISEKEFTNTDRTLSKNETFADHKTLPKEEREIINILHAMNNGAKPDQIRQLIGDKSAKWIANFVKKVEQMIGEVNTTTHKMEYKVPNGETPRKDIDIEEYVKDKLLATDQAKWKSVTQEDPSIGIRIKQKEAEQASSSLSQSSMGGG